MTKPSQAGRLDIGIGAYFHKNMPPKYEQPLRSRAINALRRAGIETMEELCATPAEELERLRLLGEKSLELVRYMRERYIAEKG